MHTKKIQHFAEAAFWPAALLRRASVLAEGQNLGAGGIHFRRACEVLTVSIKITTPFGVVIFMAAVRNLQCSSKVNSPCAKVYLIRYNKFRKLKRKFLDSVESPAFLCKRGKRGTSCKRVQSLFSLSGLHTAAAGNSDCRCGGQTVRRSPPPAYRTTGPGRRSHTGRFRGSL